MNLIAKVMSAENIPDSDARKLFTLYPVPAGAYVEFRRAGADLPAQMYFIPDSDREPNTCVPLDGVGNVYVLQDGKTISTFNPDPYPANLMRTSHLHVQGTLVEHTGPGETLTVQGDHVQILSEGTVKLQSPSLTTGVAKSNPMITGDTLYIGQLRTMLDNITRNQSWMTALNEAIIEQIREVPTTDLMVGANYGIFVSHPKSKQDDATMARYFNRVRDAFLNCTPRYDFKVEPTDNTYCLLLTPAKTLNEPPKHTPSDYFGDTVSGLLLNNIERAVSLWCNDARTVVLTRPLKVTDHERDLVKNYFRDQLNVSITFNCQADYYLSFMLTPIQ